MDISEDSIEIIKETDSESDLVDKLDKETKNTIGANNKTGTKLHTISSKLKIIKYAKENSQIKASAKFGIPKSTIHDWIKNESNFLNVSSSNLKKKNIS